ncbi:MAG: NADPH-dependent glutamate synthase [Deltaproteobacteria bacterium]|nr:NADPH-dependent glutamate synthase [Deltaproteobacteria bacterium]
MSPKNERPPRQPMPEQDPKVRARNFDEVPLGFTAEMAQAEASRCLQCKKPACRKGCPVQVLIPDFIAQVCEGNYAKAAQVLKEKNSLPAVCGRVCPQESQCEDYCVVGKKDEPVGIGRLERFVADWERDVGGVSVPSIPPATGKRVAVVGSGPAGLTVAGDLIREGHAVTIFEALHKPGGVLVYGIPEFRLPKAIVQAEVDYLTSMGVRIETNAVIGRIRTVEELLGDDGFDAVFIGAGAGLPNFLHIPGENLNGVYSANEYLTRSNLMKAYLFPEYDTPILRGRRVAVLGGGNVAMDSARTALRLGAEASIIVYRRGREEMPARVEEVHHAEEEGVELRLLTNPVAIHGDERGWVKGLECVAMELGDPDDSGRRSPRPIPDSNVVLNVDAVVVAIGNSPNPLIPLSTPAIQTTRKGTIVVDETTGATTMKGVYAGGDVVTGAATVILAMGAGRTAADAIHEYVTGPG